MAKATKQVSTKAKTRKPAKKGKRGKPKQAALLASTSVVKRGPRSAKTKQYGANFLAMECTWFDQGKPDTSDTAGTVCAAAFNLDSLAARMPLTPASERAREIMPEITRLWAVHAGDQMEPGTKHHRRYEVLTRELDRLCCLLSHRNLGDIVTAGLVAAFENDLNKDGTFHLSDIKRHPTTFDSLWTILRLGGFHRPADLQAFWYSTTPHDIAVKEIAHAAELQARE